MSLILKGLILAGAGAAAVWVLRKDRPTRNAAFADDQPNQGHMDVRDAGPEAMRDPLQREWTEVDEDIDESFPASDPPGGY
ncbi:hypothetical protein G6N82_01235 [Altererythrobacter sp. BO-6]|nr:hypothetical protein G6N82_01235 [Altererythrobacter sp. BO-6]